VNMFLSGLVWPVVAVTAMRIVPWAIVVLSSLRGCSPSAKAKLLHAWAELFRALRGR
jgi:hypothetical protein